MRTAAAVADAAADAAALMEPVEDPASVLDEYRDYPLARTASGIQFVNIADEFIA